MELKIDIQDLQPSQLYLNRNKLRSLIMNGFDAEDVYNEALPVIKHQNKFVLIDGHTRAFLASQQGVKELDVTYLPEVEDLFIYQTCIQWCLEENITSITDLGKQIISNEDFQRGWVERCRSINREGEETK